METILIRERYKIVRILYTAEDYILAEAVDIQDRETPLCLINLYSGALLHRYGRIYADLRTEQCAPFQWAFLEKDTLAAVFSDCKGIPIDQVFFRKDKWHWTDRIEYTEQVLHAALMLEALPPEIGCAALRSENVRVLPNQRTMALRYAVLPMGEMNRREMALLAGDQARKILVGRLTAPDEELFFRDQLRQGAYPSLVALYSAWREIRGQIQEGYETWEKMSWLRKGITLLKRAVKRRRAK